MHLRRLTVLPLLLVLLIPGSAWAQNVGDRVILVERALGIPGHSSPGTTAVSHRFPSGITVSVTALDPGTNWFAVRDDTGNAAWIIRTYIASVVPSGPPIATGQCYEVGLWNLEHFHKGVVRGFPENTSSGPSYPTRTAADVAAIANAIRDVIRARILVLTEINGRHDEENDAAPATSEELDDLVSRLGPSFRYILAKSGSSQRIAILWDTRFARLNAWQEMDVANPKVQGKGIFDRHPVMGHFTFLVNGQAFNDFLVDADTPRARVQ